MHENFLHLIIEGKIMGKATWVRKRMVLLHDIMEVRDYGQLKDLISDQDGDTIASEKACQEPAGNGRSLRKEDQIR